MRQLITFNNVTLDGFFTDAGSDMSWAHKQDAEWDEFVAGNASGGGVLVFGRTTYDMMAGFWPTSYALQNMPVVAERMNNLPKIVFSRKMAKAAWNNTTLIKGDIVAAMRKLKQEPGEDMAIMGSGTIVAQFAAAGLIDEYQLVVNPIALGGGRTLFDGLKEKLELRLIKTRAFKNGNVLLCYGPKV